MTDLILTGASRGIGAALIRALAARATPPRMFALARGTAELERTRAALPVHVQLVIVPCDLADRAAAARVGTELAERVARGAVLIHNAGVWPARRELVGGVERAYATHVLGPLALQAPLLAAGVVARVLVIGAGLMIKGRFDATRTPTGADFGPIRTYCNTKIAAAVAMRDVAAQHPALDFAVVHPGVVDTALGDRTGLLGWVLRRAKAKWERPEVCAARLVRILDRPRWREPGAEAPWFVEEHATPWPPCVARDEAAVRAALAVNPRAGQPER